MLVLHILFTSAVCKHVDLLYFAFLVSVLFVVELFYVKAYHLIFFFFFVALKLGLVFVILVHFCRSL